MINYGKQFIDTKDISSVSKILKSNWLTQGLNINKFENALKKKFGSKYCCAVSSGTAALHLAGLALGWKSKDIVLSSTISFVASSNSIIYAGATPDFVDINENDYNIDIEKIEKKIKFHKQKNNKVVAIIATDFAGHPCDWKSLKEISKKYNLNLVNDNCHAIGASYKKNLKYASKYADVVTHSYHPVKNITTGEGGAVFTNSKIIDQKVRMLRSHGINKNTSNFSKRHGSWYYEMQNLGFNYRITDFQCALGLSQLKKLNKFVKKRKEIAKIYNKVRLPFNVNSAASEAAIASINDKKFTSKCLKHNEFYLNWLTKEIINIGLTPIESVANFVLVKFPKKGRFTSKKVYKFLLSKGIILRTVNNYGLRDFLRISIGKKPELFKLVKFLKIYFKIK